jgi:DNA-binding NarL/FixJ family response regulator
VKKSREKGVKRTLVKGEGPSQSAAAARKRIMIIDDHPVTRMGLTALINGQPDMVVCCEAADPARAQRLISGCRADLILADLAMPGRSGTELIKDLRASDPKAKILVLSMQDESFYGPRVLRAGARGYVMKNAGGDQVLIAMRQILAGGTYVSAALSGQIIGDMAEPVSCDSKSAVCKLTDREFEIFRLIGQGGDTHDIVQQLHLSPRTVDVHRASIRKKLGLLHSTALVHYAVRWAESETAGRSSRGG